MSKTQIPLATFGLLLALANVGNAGAPTPDEAKAVSLLDMVREYKYPGSKFSGAESSDAAISDICSIKSQAVLTSPDSVEKVVAFFLQKLNVDAKGKNLDEKPGERITTQRSVSVQNNSVGRPLALYIIKIDEKESTTTLVISRVEGEDTTHIAWSNWRQLKL